MIQYYKIILTFFGRILILTTMVIMKEILAPGATNLLM